MNADPQDEPPVREQLAEQLERARERISESPDLVRSGIAEQVDRTLALLQGDGEAAAAQVLSRIGGSMEVEARIARELLIEVPMADPLAFGPAHRRAIRALEILDRDGTRDPKLPRLGPLKPLAEEGVEFVAEYIVKSYAATVATRLRDLYARREPQCPPNTQERALFRGARVEMERLTPGFSGGGRGVPLLLVGGISAPIAATSARYFGAIEWTSQWVWLGLTGLAFLLLIAATSVLFAGTAVAHRRCQLIMRETLMELYAAIGNCGNPPKDQGLTIATVGVVLTVICWIILPAGAAVAYFGFLR